MLIEYRGFLIRKSDGIGFDVLSKKMYLLAMVATEENARLWIDEWWEKREA